MKISILKEDLLIGLQRVQNVVGIRSTLPILANVLLSAEKDKLTLTTTDLDVTVRCTVKAQVQKTGASTLPARRFMGVVRELPDKLIEIEIDEKNITSIKCESSFFKIIGLSDDEFPPVKKPEGKYSYHLDQGAFKEILKKTAYAASLDETRYVLNGVLMNFKANKLIVVATDGRRLALVEHEVEFPKESESSIILPSKTVVELMHNLGDDGKLDIYIGGNQAAFEFDDIFISSKLIDGAYPNYKQVIPSQFEERVVIDRESLLSALKRVSILTADKANAAKLSFGKNRLTITTNTPDIGEARETVPIKYSGKEINVAFNADYIIDPLRNLSSDEIYFELTDDLSPGVIKCDIPFLYVLMPMRIT